jgi:hypothetical protein
MLFTIFLVGAALACAVLFAKQINTYGGMGISHKSIHAYFTTLGALSSQVIPAVCVIAVMLAGGLVIGIGAIALILSASLLTGYLIGRLDKFWAYYTKMLGAMFGVPITLVMFIASL